MLLSSCGEKLYYGDVNCSECYSPKPDSAFLEILLTPDENRGIPLSILKGDVENGQIEFMDTVYGSLFRRWLAVDVPYSVKVEYYANADTIYAVDGTTIRFLKVTDACDVECYVIDNEKIDVRLGF